jgi:hypothetical protein
MLFFGQLMQAPGYRRQGFSSRQSAGESAPYPGAICRFNRATRTMKHSSRLEPETALGNVL